MDRNQSNYKGQVGINDLIGDVVNNAVARRNHFIDSQDALPALSDEETESIAGDFNLLIYVGGLLGLISNA
ncbi:hypothetical protein H6G97_28760 [Nostoc flagelliforme FACHB-838]|uniref:Uncharacterized protein n=1 Tax=Nostoc flagelliforme FACHB-838 TaxID=2692904 RepID=A0ABR8DYK3_9NOSO|nr:hypothetical protein [Nostoc flagelliforme]MBD2533340.1 hypothetical protein [Nostoc flagelliforme FACHB-838]